MIQVHFAKEGGELWSMLRVKTSRPGCWKTNLTMIKQRPSSCDHLLSPFQSANLLISFSSSSRNLGFYIRDDMSVELHIKNVCRSAYSELRRISTIRHLLSADSTKTLVSAFVFSRLDYSNSLLSGCPKHFLEKLRKVQDWAARLVFKAHIRDHVSPLLRTLHWQPIQAGMSISCQHSVTPFSLIQPAVGSCGRRN